MKLIFSLVGHDLIKWTYWTKNLFGIYKDQKSISTIKRVKTYKKKNLVVSRDSRGNGRAHWIRKEQSDKICSCLKKNIEVQRRHSERVEKAETMKLED